MVVNLEGFPLETKRSWTLLAVWPWPGEMCEWLSPLPGILFLSSWVVLTSSFGSICEMPRTVG